MYNVTKKWEREEKRKPTTSKHKREATSKPRRVMEEYSQKNTEMIKMVPEAEPFLYQKKESIFV